MTNEKGIGISRSKCRYCDHAMSSHKLEHGFDVVAKRAECGVIGCPCKEFQYGSI